MSNKIENTWDCLVEPPTVNSFLLLLVLYGGSISDSLYCIAEAGLVNLLILMTQRKLRRALLVHRILFQVFGLAPTEILVSQQCFE